MRIVIFDNEDYNHLLDENNYINDNENAAYKEYIDKYGMHFNKTLVDFAVSSMLHQNPSTGELEQPITPITKSKLDSLMSAYDITVNNNKLYDYVYVANMCKADFVDSSVIDDKHLCLYVKDVIDDVDGYDGLPFARWLADVKQKAVKVDWKSMLE